MIKMVKPEETVVSSLPEFPAMLELLQSALEDDTQSYDKVLTVSPYTYQCMEKEYTQEDMETIDKFLEDNNIRVGEPSVPHLGTTYFDSVYWPYNLELPRRGSELAAGYDFILPKKVIVTDAKPVRIFLGVKCVIDPKLKASLNLYIRSKFSTTVSLLNAVGIVDADYADSPECNGDIQAVVQCKPGAGPVELDAGECLVQGIISPYFTVDFDIPKKIKRHGGFGSSDKDRTIEVEVVKED